MAFAPPSSCWWWRRRRQHTLQRRCWMLAVAKKSTAAATLQQRSWWQKANRRECGDVGTEQEQLRQQQTNYLERQTRQRWRKEGAVAMMSVVAGSSCGALSGGCQLVFMAVVSWRNRNMKFVRKFVFSNFCVTQENGKERK
jgi:hypothetical protein